MIEEAIANRNYRFALRLNYLRSLKILSDKEIINWKIDKTNHEFIGEIKHSNLKSTFQISQVSLNQFGTADLK